MFVKVIVDIPAAQVNRPFDYQVPAEWQEVIQLGMRVSVPFGKRVLMGFVVAISDTCEFEGKIKPIQFCLDYVSFLNDELIELSDYLAQELQVFRIAILQTMLPSVLKVKYETVIQRHNHQVLREVLPQEILEKEELLREELEQYVSPSKIKQLLEQNMISVDYRIKQKNREKQEMLIVRHLSDEDYNKIFQSLRKNAVQQQQLIEILLTFTQGTHISRKMLQTQFGISAAVLKKAIESEWVQVSYQTVYRTVVQSENVVPTEKKILTEQQQNALEHIQEALVNHREQVFLLEGVTGSGKTEVYLQLMEEARDKGLSALLLVPEISLTPQMVARVVERFQTGVAVLHSGLSAAEKYDEWRRIMTGEATIVVGARSSVFAPLERLGIIIIDEEHEMTYKQSEMPRYHAREVAIWRSQFHHCPVVLGSATPSLESRARAQVSKYQLIQMTQRTNQRPLPEIKLIDMTQVLGSVTDHEISPELLNKMKEEIAKGHQVVLLLNKRGYASYVQCHSCGNVIQCPKCDISLTYHKSFQQMKCHYCDYTCAFQSNCPYCGSAKIQTKGTGTQKVEETLYALMPGVRVIRMDNDTTRRKGAHETLLTQFESKQADILLGTQMIAKGLDFENVTLVGVINADTALNIPDFRAGEKTFQLLTQVAGRTGRGRYDGQVYIQTYNINHTLMQLVQQHDYEQFFYYEMQRRRLAHYPPYFYTALITVSSKQQAFAQKHIYQIKEHFAALMAQSAEIIEVLGPSRGAIAKINDVYYFQLLIKYKNKNFIQPVMRRIVQEAQVLDQKGIYTTVDYEPYHFI